MSYPYFREDNLDDLLREVYTDILENGQEVEPSKGATVERIGVLLHLQNPRARLSRTETKGHVFSPLGELCWYLAGSRDVDFISYYIPEYRQAAEGNAIWGAYGPRLYDWHGQDQLKNITSLLREHPNSRRAVIQLFDACDLGTYHKDIPCTTTLQFFVRESSVELLTSMRSNDAFKGLPHDAFCFTVFQELIARTLGIPLGSYRHMVGSLHFYADDLSRAKRFLEEGWQSTDILMPAMPEGDPWPAVQRVLKFEESIRFGERNVETAASELHPYWADIVRLLVIFRHVNKAGDPEAALAAAGNLSSPTYRIYVQRQLAYKGFQDT